MRKVLRSLSFLITVILPALVAASPIYAQPAFDPPGLDVAIAAQERYTNALQGIEGVVGTAVGWGADGGAVVKIYTEKSGVGGLPRSLDGVPVVVQVTGKIFALNKPDENGNHNHGNGGGGGGGGGEEVDPTARFPRPVPIGVSSGNAKIGNICTAGTLGARVTGGGVFALSNNHVYALENPAALDEPITQPGALDTGCIVDLDNDVIGNVAAVVPINFNNLGCVSGQDPPDCNTVDAAIASTTKALVGNSTPADGYGTPKSAPVAEAIDLAVQKYGRTTSLTKGTITGVNAIVNVRYDSGRAKFELQIIVEGKKPFLKAGDSGSLLVTDPGLNPVGLLFAGNQSGKLAVANPIDLVLTALDAALGPPPLTIDGAP